MNSGQKRRAGSAWRRRCQMISMHARPGKDRTKARRKTQKGRKGPNNARETVDSGNP